jgi:hypothetical protein
VCVSCRVRAKRSAKKAKQSAKRSVKASSAHDDDDEVAVSVRDWSLIATSDKKDRYLQRYVGAPMRRLGVQIGSGDDAQLVVFVLQARHDLVDEVVAELVKAYPPRVGELAGAATLSDLETRQRIGDVAQLYHDQVLLFEYESLQPAAPKRDVHVTISESADPDADIDDKLAMQQVLQPSRKSDAQIDAELDALLGEEKQHKTARAPSRSVGKSRDWAAKSRDRLQSSFRDLAERLQERKPANVNGAIVETQLEELRALREAYDAPLLVVGDAVPLRLAFRIGGAEACELAERAAPESVAPCQLCVVVQLPVAYPKAAAVVSAFWTLPPPTDRADVLERVEQLGEALRSKCAANVGAPLLHELMTDASDWLAAFVHDPAVVALAEQQPKPEITEEHRVAWIRGLQWVFKWKFDQWPAPEADYLFYEAKRQTALGEFVDALCEHVRVRDPTVADDAPLLGWVGAAPVDDATLSAYTTPRRLLASGRAVVSRFLGVHEWSVDAAMRVATAAPWPALVASLGVDGDGSAPLVQTPMHATQLLLAHIDGDTGAESEVECPICLCDTPVSECTALPCGHWYCNGCYTSYVSLEVSEARVSGLQCPAKTCVQPLGDTSAMLLLGASKPATRLLRFAATAQVADDNRAMQCLSNGCGQVMHAVARTARTSLAPGAFSACDKCTAVKCLRCPLAGHWPHSCETASWARMIFKAKMPIKGDDEELLTLRWIANSTKDCPKCGTAIEKNMGCNHMRCLSNVKCNYEFCWVCLAPWTGAHYSCEASKEASHASVERYASVALSFIGLRQWHQPRLSHAKAVLASHVRALADELRAADEYGDARVLRDAFQFVVVARELVISAAELGECLKCFSMPGQKQCKQFCLDVTAIAEQLHDVVFDEPSRDPSRSSADEITHMFATMMDRAVVEATGVQTGGRSARRGARRTTADERLKAFSLGVASLTAALRSLNQALRSHLWERKVAQRLPKLIAAAKAAGQQRGKSIAREHAERIAVRVHVHRVGDGTSVGKELLVSTHWRVFVHEAARAVGIIDDDYEVEARNPATVFLRNGARISGVEQLTHDDLVFVAPRDERFRMPTVVAPTIYMTQEEWRAYQLKDAAPPQPVPLASANKWRELMRKVVGTPEAGELEREKLWERHEPAILQLARVLPDGLVSYNELLTSLLNVDGSAVKALKLIALTIGASTEQTREWESALEESLIASKRPAGEQRPIAEVWDMQQSRNEADARRRVLEEAAQADAVHQIRAVLPHVTDRTAARAWLANGRNVEAAMGQLLDNGGV